MEKLAKQIPNPTRTEGPVNPGLCLRGNRVLGEGCGGKEGGDDVAVGVGGKDGSGEGVGGKDGSGGRRVGVGVGYAILKVVFISFCHLLG